MNTNAEDRDINQKLHEARNLCWHDVHPLTFKCRKCDKHSLQVDGCKNPAYDSDLNAAFDLVEWMRKEKGWKFRIEAEAKDWSVKIAPRYPFKAFASSRDESLARAIALAAIRALEEK